jgi:hypothetical protein
LEGHENVTWEVLDIENGDVVAVYGSLDEAKSELAAFVENHPERCDDLAIATIDDAGHAVGDVLPAAELVAHA